MDGGPFDDGNMNGMGASSQMKEDEYIQPDNSFEDVDVDAAVGDGGYDFP